MQTSAIKKKLVLALLLVTGSAWADWVRVDVSETTYRYIDPATIRRDGSLVRVWEMEDLKQRHKEGELSRRARVEYDCKQERFKFLSFSFHSEAMASGTTLASQTGTHQWTDIPPNSMAENVLKIVCAK